MHEEASSLFSARARVTKLFVRLDRSTSCRDLAAHRDLPCHARRHAKSVRMRHGQATMVGIVGQQEHSMFKFRNGHGVPTSLVWLGTSAPNSAEPLLLVRTPYRGSSPPFSLQMSNLQPHADMESPHQLRRRYASNFLGIDGNRHGCHGPRLSLLASHSWNIFSSHTIWTENGKV